MNAEQVEHLMTRFNQEPKFRGAVGSYNPNPHLWRRLLPPRYPGLSYATDFTLDSLQAQMHGLHKDFQPQVEFLNNYPLSPALALSKLPFSDVEQLRQKGFGVWPSFDTPDSDLLRIINPNLTDSTMDLIMSGQHPRSVIHLEDVGLRQREWGALWFDSRKLTANTSSSRENNLIPNIFEVLSALDYLHTQQEDKEGDPYPNSGNQWLVTSSTVHIDLKKQYSKWLKDRSRLAAFFRSAVLERYVLNGSEINDILTKEATGILEHETSRPLKKILKDGSYMQVFQDQVQVIKGGQLVYESISDDYLTLIIPNRVSWSLRMGALEIQDVYRRTSSLNFDEEVLEPLRRLLKDSVLRQQFTSGIDLPVGFRSDKREGLLVGICIPPLGEPVQLNGISVFMLDGALSEIRRVMPELDFTKGWQLPAIYRDQDASRLLS